MNLSTLIGVVGSVIMLVFSILSGRSTILAFVDIPSIILVFICPFIMLFTAFSIQDVFGVFGIIGITFKVPNYNEQGIITKLMAMSEKARREGLLALEEELEDLDDEFMKKGMRLVVDGTDAEIIRSLMENELNQMQDRHIGKTNIMGLWASSAPAVGMMGTVIGLVGMLKNLEDKSALGPNMAVALITTFYGSLIANFTILPWIAKLKSYDAMETKVKEMEIEGVLSIQAGDNPRILATKLLSYLNPQDRKVVEAEVLKD
ncbi:MAG: MotA/TolQ/ExbB proton channel family protein [Treponema sp.]|nr:MotA/TolQ/ExbB proton channel family protein [Treponema sp.]